MRQQRSALVAGMALLVLTVSASAALARVRISVTPSSGRPHTAFVIDFRAPATTGVFADGSSRYVVSASAPARHGCVSYLARGVAPTKQGVRAHATLKPSAGHHWCAGRFAGRLTEIFSLHCTPPADACPALAGAPLLVARFWFRVSR